MWKRSFLILYATFCLGLCFTGHADDPIGDGRKNAIVTAIERVSPAVVTINVVELRQERVRDPFYNEFWGFFDFPLRRAPLRGRAIESLGSGFLFDADGHIITNYHVLEDADLITSVTLADGRSLEIEVVGGDRHSDIAILKAKGDNLPFIPLGHSDDLMVGEWVIAIGNPFGAMMRDPQPSVSVGVVSANHRRVSRDIAGGDRFYQDMIQTDAAINPGNSGGPLVNTRGEVIGVNTMIFSSSGGSQGLGFAIPIARVQRVAQEIIQYGRRRQPWLGFRGDAVGLLREYARHELRITARSGVLVSEIVRKSPSFQAGLRLGDVIIEINGERVLHPADVDFVTWGLFVGDEVTLLVERLGERKTFRFAVKEFRGR